MKQNSSSKQRKKLIRQSILLVVILTLIILWGYFAEEIASNADFFGLIIDMVAIVIAGFGAVMIVVQLHDSKNIQQAEFIVNLNQAFVENSDYASAYTELEKSYMDNQEPNLSRIEISNYMTFFETVYILLRNKVISMEVLDDLFAYRFFIAVHNETVQKVKIIDSPQNFRNIYYLEKLWVDYRREKGLEIFKEENSLKKVMMNNNKLDIYNKIMNEMTGSGKRR